MSLPGVRSNLSSFIAWIERSRKECFINLARAASSPEVSPSPIHGPEKTPGAKTFRRWRGFSFLHPMEERAGGEEVRFHLAIEQPLPFLVPPLNSVSSCKKSPSHPPSVPSSPNPDLRPAFSSVLSLHVVKRRGSQVVRQGSAKALCVGSIPTLASIVNACASTTNASRGGKTSAKT